MYELEKLFGIWLIVEGIGAQAYSTDQTAPFLIGRLGRIGIGLYLLTKATI